MLKKSFSILLAFVVLLSFCFPVTAADVLKKLPSNQDLPVDFETYDVSGNETEFQPALRGKDFQIKWRYDLDLPSNLIVDKDKTLYAIDTDGNLYAIDVNGQKKWEKSLNTNWIPRLALGSDGTIYVVSEGSPLDEENRGGSLFALSQDGTEKWTTKIDEPLEYLDYSFAGDRNGNCYIPTKQGLVSYNGNGIINWINKDVVKLGEQYLFGSNIRTIKVDENQNLFITTEDKEILSLDLNGALRWKISKEVNSFDFYISKLGYLYYREGKNLIVIDGDNGRVLTKEEISKIPTTDFITPEGWSSGAYLPNDWSKIGVMSLNNSGAVKWRYNATIGSNGEPFSIRADKNGNVYFADCSGNIFSLDQNGNERFILLRKNKMFTGTELYVTRQGDLISLSEETGLLCIGKPRIEVFLNGTRMTFEEPPVIENGTTLVPFRAIFEQLGLEVTWNDKTKTVSGIKEDLNISIAIGNKTAYVNGKSVQLSAAPKIINGNTLVPLRFVAESAGQKVSWDDKKKIISITSD